MARKTSIDWQAVRDDYEIRGMSYSEIAIKYGIDKSSISKKSSSEGWSKGIIQPLINKKVEAVQTISEINEKLITLAPASRVAVEEEFNKRLRLAALMSDGIEKSQRLANQLLDKAESLGTDNEDGFKAALIATDNHSKVTQRNAATVFVSMPERNNQQADTRFNSIADKLRAKHASRK